MGGENGSRDPVADSRIGLKRALTSEAASPDKQAPQKRSRVSRACDQCRASREKCDGGQPICHTCTAQKRSCSYDEQPKKRGIQPNYIRTLELTLSWLFRTFPDNEKKLASTLAASDATTRQLIAGKDGQSEALHLGWRNSIICRQIDQMLSGSTLERPKDPSPEETYQSPPLSAPSDQTTAQADISTVAEASFSGKVTRVAHIHPQSATQVHLSLNYQPQLEPHQNIDPELHLDALADERIRLPDRAWTLLEYYFAFTHAWLPMTDKQAMLKLMYTYPTNGVIRFDAMNGDYAELWSILALAAAQIPNEELKAESEHYRDISRSLIPSERTTYELGHVKAMIVLAVLEINRQQWMAAWMHVGLAVRVIVVLTSARATEQLEGNTVAHPALNAAEIGASRSERFKHIGLSAFVLESAVASRIGAPSHLQCDQVNALGLLDEDGLEEWSPWHDPLSTGHSANMKAPARSFSTLNQLVRLALRNESAAWTVPGQPPSTVLCNVVLRLAHNATQPANRFQPAIIVSQCETLQHTPTTESRALQSHLNLGEEDRLPWQDILESTAQPVPHQDHQQLGYMSIPEPTESAISGSPAVPTHPNPGSGIWAGSSTREAIDPHLDLDGGSTVNGADIFEELAMLERTDTSQHPQFMQNLGFAPDIDLAEFFGADYQPSDPMLAFMQPSVFGASNTDQPLPDAG